MTNSNLDPILHLLATVCVLIFKVIQNQ